MSRHTLICRLGTQDGSAVKPFWRDAVVSEVNFLDLLGELDYGLGHALDKLGRLGLRPEVNALDLLLLASMIFAADSRIPRKAEAQDGWTREININLPVANLVVWDSARELLAGALRFLTGDIWHFTFRQRSKELEPLLKPVQGELRVFQCVSLFSGGLDSYIGAVDLLKKGMQPLFVSHYLPHTSKEQVQCIEHLQGKYGEDSMEFFRANIGFESSLLKVFGKGGKYPSENTERSRSFLFFSLAALAASSFGNPTKIFVPENGLIALNVPLDWLRIGALSTRTTHPFYMARINDLLHILGIKAKLENPYRHQTKGEMIQQSADKEFIGETLKETMSCSSPSKYRQIGESRMHCGHCVPCLIRRAAVKAAFGRDHTQYARKLSGVLNSSKAVGEHVRSFQLAFAKLKSLPKYSTVAVRIPGPLNDVENEFKYLVSVFERGMTEVAALLKTSKTRPS